MSSASTETQWSVSVKIKGEIGQLIFTTDMFSVLRLDSKGVVSRKPTLKTSLKNVLWASLAENGQLVVSTLASKKNALVLVTVTGAITVGQSEAQEWVTRIMDKAYDGVAPNRKLKVLVNPKGGPGKAKGIFEKRVKPILEAARCVLDIEFTTHRFHAQEIAQALPLEYDAIVALSGDGLLHEILNGLAMRADVAKAIHTPVVPVPTGSANGFNLNLQGLEGGMDVGLACLNVIKGTPMQLDLCSVTQGETRTWSYFSQAFGLMADLDLGTENLRWMGDVRFVIGYLRGLAASKPCPVKLSIKVAVSDKKELLKQFDEVTPARAIVADFESLPNDVHASEQAPAAEWITFDKPILYVYGGLAPYVARDLLQFPIAKPSDGFLDLVVQEVTTRTEMLGAMDGAEKGAQFYLGSQHYYKTRAYRIEPLPSAKGLISIDGEAYPWGPIYIEAHQGLATTFSLHGHFVTNFIRK